MLPKSNREEFQADDISSRVHLRNKRKTVRIATEAPKKKRSSVYAKVKKAIKGE